METIHRPDYSGIIIAKIDTLDEKVTELNNALVDLLHEIRGAKKKDANLSKHD